MKGSLTCLAIFSACLICFDPKTVSAIPDITLVPRQESCETLFCGPDWGDSGEWFKNLLQQPDPSPPSGLMLPAPESQPTSPQPETLPQSPETLPPVPGIEPQNSDFGKDPSLEPEMIRVAPDPGTESCQSVASSTDPESQNIQQNDPVGHISKAISEAMTLQPLF